MFKWRSIVATFRRKSFLDYLYFTDWQGDSDERLAGPGTEIGRVLADVARRGVQVRALL